MNEPFLTWHPTGHGIRISPRTRVEGIEGEYVVSDHGDVYRWHPEKLDWPLATRDESGWRTSCLSFRSTRPLHRTRYARLIPALDMRWAQVQRAIAQERLWKAARHPAQVTFPDFALRAHVPLEQIAMILAGVHPALEKGMECKHPNANVYAGGRPYAHPDNAGFRALRQHEHECSLVAHYMGPEYVLQENVERYGLQKVSRFLPAMRDARQAFFASAPRRLPDPRLRCPVSGIQYSVGSQCSLCPPLDAWGCCDLCQEAYPSSEWRAHLESHAPSAKGLAWQDMVEFFSPLP